MRNQTIVIVCIGIWVVGGWLALRGHAKPSPPLPPGSAETTMLGIYIGAKGVLLYRQIFGEIPDDAWIDELAETVMLPEDQMAQKLKDLFDPTLQKKKPYPYDSMQMQKINEPLTSEL